MEQVIHRALIEIEPMDEEGALVPGGWQSVQKRKFIMGLTAEKR